MSVSSLRIGVIGTGFGARVVAPIFAATDGCEVTGIVSARDDGRVAALVARADVDLVSIHSPPYLHAPHVRLALEHGKAVLCDKPFAMSPAEASELEAEADAAGVVHLVNFEFRYHPARQMLRDLVARGDLGRVEHVSWVHLSAGTRVPMRPFGWLFDRSLGGGWIGAWASHAVDTLRFCFGDVVAAVGFPRVDIAERPDRDGVMHTCTAEDGLTASLELERGITVAIDSSYAALGDIPPRLVVTGDEGVLELVADERFTVTRGDGTREVSRVEATQGVDADRHHVAMHNWATAVRDAVLGREVPGDVPTFADGRACDAVLARLAGIGGSTDSDALG